MHAALAAMKHRRAPASSMAGGLALFATNALPGAVPDPRARVTTRGDTEPASRNDGRRALRVARAATLATSIARAGGNTDFAVARVGVGADQRRQGLIFPDARSGDLPVGPF